MRIVGGRLKGRLLKGPPSDAIRPTSDRLRETVFNILAHAYGDPAAHAQVIDVFAGTGAMGFEALSRGAQSAVFVDNSAKACALLRANADALGLRSVIRILQRDARRIGTPPDSARFTLAFLDPPYGKELVTPALTALRDGNWLDENALLVIEEHAASEVSLPPGFVLCEARRFGTAQIVISRFQ
ncbi:MAG TPA: 16S rRNA (guanine(966)-N(2))-methyltransferase RsmD [Methylocella sp.]|nr:16S rRNA (guanine(966)-N(2))-methyltransferase RsmD [Methylocella sp.]